MGRLKYKGYSGTVEYDESVGYLVGKIVGLKKALILYEGNSIEELQKDFEEAVDDYLESCKANGVEPEQPYSGKLVLRMSSKLHGAAAEKAEKDLIVDVRSKEVEIALMEDHRLIELNKMLDLDQIHSEIVDADREDETERKCTKEMER